ncbi:LysR family transcriptional regulator [Tateyamaria omphalii]|uniref:LysR family transcriptional regulator n=1 Tax=Tateyamaria omphalii TaxID=299262 RepID=UPI00167BF205|nr:LysR family transcriptional regulator [Tateyamaria omphalii]GGX41949.1 LysR family transcriptional regulator [Tateyamaria omphalii]
MDALNYHHLRYFRAVAHEGNLTRAADKLNLSQSALSTQIKALEARLGHALFDRVGRQLKLTEVGRIALDHADRIFGTGRELMETLNRSANHTPPLRVGALSTLSRNFQIQFLRPILDHPDVDIVLKSGQNVPLLRSLSELALDVVLTTEAPTSAAGSDFIAHRLAGQAVGLHGKPDRMRHKTLKSVLETEAVIVPTESAIRTGFNRLTARLGVQPRIVADVDDMAMVRLLAREGIGLALAPEIVLADEIASGQLVTAPFNTGITDTFYAVTTRRSFPHPMLDMLLPD